jgi:GT2 family glycosyltransferase
MEANPRVGWAMPRVTYPDGREQQLCRRLASPLDLIWRRFFPAGWTMSRERQDRYLCKDLDLSVARNIPSLSGCFMFLRTKAIRDIGGFDERYFLYMEDFDYSRRMGEYWDTAYYPHVMICHRHERGSYRSWKLLGRHVRSAVRYYNKWGWIWDPGRACINRRAAANPPEFRLPELDRQYRYGKFEVKT